MGQGKEAGMTQDEAEDAIRELLTKWVAARIEEAGEE